MSQFEIVDGWVTGCDKRPSPHFNQRPENETIKLLVIHNISLPPGEYGSDDISTFFEGRLDHTRHPFFEQIKDLRVSAHNLIRRDGKVIQYVAYNQRAWHAGVSTFEQRENCNDFSIGIEMEGTDNMPYTDEQYQALADLTKTLQSTYTKITRERIVGHSDIAPGRKTDPGPAFDWQRYLALLSD